MELTAMPGRLKRKRPQQEISDKTETASKRPKATRQLSLEQCWQVAFTFTQKAYKSINPSKLSISERKQEIERSNQNGFAKARNCIRIKTNKLGISERGQEIRRSEQNGFAKASNRIGPPLKVTLKGNKLMEILTTSQTEKSEEVLARQRGLERGFIKPLESTKLPLRPKPNCDPANNESKPFYKSVKPYCEQTTLSTVAASTYSRL